MATIGMAGTVSATHVLSAANHSGLQWGTVRNVLLAWVLTLPAAMILSGFLFWTPAKRVWELSHFWSYTLESAALDARNAAKAARQGYADELRKVLYNI